MRHFCIAIAASTVLLAGRAGAGGVTPTSLGSEPLPYGYGAPYGYRPAPAYGPTSPYALAPYTYSLQRRNSSHSPQHAFRATRYGPAPSVYGTLSRADGLLPSYGSNPEYGVPSPVPHDQSARLKAWNAIADSFTEALRQVRSAPSLGRSEFASRSATRPP